MLVFCILVVGSGGCATQPGNDFVKDALSRGAQLEQQGQYFRAAETYVAVLRTQPEQRNARAGLTRTLDQAITEKLSSATVLEAELRPAEAIAEIDAARRLLERSAPFNIEGGQTSAVESRRLQLINRRVQALLAEAERAREDSLWSAALAHLQQVETLSPGYGETREKMREVWVEWANTNEREGRLRAAAERLEEAARIPGERSGVTSARAAAIRSVLGLSELQNGACRAAATDLRAAERLAPGSIDPAVLEQAIACASSCVQISITAEPGSDLDETQRGFLRAELRRQIASGASEFLHVRDSGAGSPRGCDRRLVPGVDGSPMSVGPYSISVRITAIRSIRQPASSSTRQARSWNGNQTETVVTFQEYVEVLSGTMSGWVTVTDDRSRVAGVPQPLRVADETRSRWQGNAVSAVTSRSNAVSTATHQGGMAGRSSTGVVIGPGRGRAQADEARRQARVQLTERLVQSFAAEAVRMSLSVVDAEPAVPDPTELPDAEVQ